MSPKWTLFWDCFSGILSQLNIEIFRLRRAGLIGQSSCQSQSSSYFHCEIFDDQNAENAWKHQFGSLGLSPPRLKILATWLLIRSNFSINCWYNDLWAAWPGVNVSLSRIYRVLVSRTQLLFSRWLNRTLIRMCSSLPVISIITSRVVVEQDEMSLR